MPGSRKLLEAYRDGIVAATKKKPFKSNPFNSLSERELWLEWRKGYLRMLVAVNENEDLFKGKPRFV